jgi:Glutamine amidotransferase class-I
LAYRGIGNSTPIAILGPDYKIGLVEDDVGWRLLGDKLGREDHRPATLWQKFRIRVRARAYAPNIFSENREGPMPNVLIADGTPAVWQAERAVFGIPSNFSLFAAAVQLHCPDARCTPVNIADGEPLPRGTTLADFDGVMVPGSPLHIYDPTPSVTRQIDFVRAAVAAGVPVWGSCWGLQLATVALGGSVRRNPRGRELPIARAIKVTEAGRAHPFLASRPAVFDALCSHLASRPSTRPTRLRPSLLSANLTVPAENYEKGELRLAGTLWALREAKWGKSSKSVH